MLSLPARHRVGKGAPPGGAGLAARADSLPSPCGRKALAAFQAGPGPGIRCRLALDAAFVSIEPVPT